MYKKEKSFTIIEILVVMAVINLMATFILVGAKEAKEKAKLVKIIVFAETVHHTIGSEAVGIWNFNEGSVDTCGAAPYNDFCDSSNYNNHGGKLVVGGSITWQEHNISQLKQAYRKYCEINSFAIGGGVAIAHNSILNAIDRITISLWVKPSDSGSRTVINKNKSNGQYAVEIMNLEPEFKIGGRDGNPTLNRGLGAGVDIPLNEWSHIVFTFKTNLINNYSMECYINGNKVNSTQQASQIIPYIDNVEPLYYW